MKSQKITFGILLGFVLSIFGYFFYSVNFLIEDSYTVIEGADLSVMLPPFITSDGGSLEASGSDAMSHRGDSVKTVNLKVLNLFDIAQAKVKTIETPRVHPSGQCVGIKIYTGGLVVSGFGDFETDSGICVSPGARAGLEAGDIIAEINGEGISSVNQFTKICDSCGGECTLGVMRGDKKLNLRVKGEQAPDGHMRLGIFVKNSLAGVGTLTYVSPDTGTFGALGHGITESGTVVPIREASVYDARIINIVKGKKGTPGEIIGAIDEDKIMGVCVNNTEEGVYGTMTESGALFPEVMAAPSSEVKTGKAYIICTADSDTGPEYYEAEIVSVNHLRQNKTKSFSVEVTDKELIEKTGGIVQGMSGSPVIQNGKLVGAVTHVFVNDPTRGYGIFIENMLSEADNIK